MAKIIIGDSHFKSKKEAKDYIRQILIKVGPGNSIPSTILPFFLTLFERHPEHKMKVGTGVAALNVVRNSLNARALELRIMRNDGSATDISWLTCIDGKGASALENLVNAMRRAIRDDISAFREEEFRRNSSCRLCSAPISDGGHIDHVEPFEQIASNFLKGCSSHPIEFDDDPEVNVAVFKEKDFEFRQNWISYHNLFAHLRLTCSRCNLSRKKK